MDKLKEKYKLKGDPDMTKTELSNDAYAICEFIESLFNKLEHIRIQNLK